MTDPLLAALFDRLPDPSGGARFDPFDRSRWLAALAACLDVVYGPPTAAKSAPAAPAHTPVDEPRRGPTPTRVPCERCGVPLGPQGRPAHMAMHRREDEREARKTTAPAPALEPAAVVAEAETPPPLRVAEPITRQPFDPDAARRRAAAAL